jgi:low temperature requirement protein LtrA
VFFAIWWAWMNFTWFASAYDTDDVVYRLAALVQIAGVLVLAAGVPRALEGQDFGLAVLGYAIMRVGLVGNWLRAAAGDPARRTTCRRFAAGVLACEVGWIALFAAPDGLWLPGFAVLAAAELAVPVWAERATPTAWHPHHIAERYGLFTIIVLGESVLAATLAVQRALDAGDAVADLAAIAGGALLIVFAVWWIYFDMPAEQVVDRARRGMSESRRAAFLWGYGHYVVFAAIAAAGAGIALAVDQASGTSTLSDVEAGFAVTVPVACYLIAIWTLHAPDKRPGPMRTFAAPIGALLTLAAGPLGRPVLSTGLILAGLVAASVVAARRAEAHAGDAVAADAFARAGRIPVRGG